MLARMSKLRTLMSDAALFADSVSLSEGPEMYRVFRDKRDSCVKVGPKP